MNPNPTSQPLQATITLLTIVATMVIITARAGAESAQAGLMQDSVPVLSPGASVEGVLASDQPRTYRVNLRLGQFVRIVSEGNIELQMIGPGQDRLQLARGVLSHVAQETGPHLLRITRFQGLRAPQRYTIRLDAVLSRAQYAALEGLLRRDPRVQWLARHAIPLRSVSDDDDYTDLRPIRNAIGDAHVVLVGEESHANGRVITANARLVKFLHRELGFDVIAFEAGLYDMWKVWQLIEAGHDPTEVMPQGLYGVWAQAADFQPLARYIGEQVAGPNPLEVIGVDYQLSGTLSRQQLVPELRDLVARERIAVEGQELVDGFWTSLAGFRMGAPRDSLPELRDQEDVLSGVRWLAERIGEIAEARSGSDQRQYRMWAQVCRSLAEFMEATWGTVGEETANFNRRERQMARNLIWLAREYFPGRKIIVWAANPHVLRYPHRLEPQRSMGQYVWEAMGGRSFVITATAYGGQYRWFNSSQGPWTVASDADTSFELEELLAATGLEHAVLPLKNVPSGGEWLRTPIVSRLHWNYQPKLATWPDHTDAILFLRESAPRVRKGKPTEIEVPLAMLERYVGKYELRPDFEMIVTVEEGHLNIQGTGQLKFKMFAMSETRFFPRQFDAQVEFDVVDGVVRGLTFFEDGVGQYAKRIE